MTVLICIPCLLTGGTEIQTLSLVEALVAAGHKPVVACYFEYAEGMVRCYEAAGAEVRLLSSDSSRVQGVKATAKHLWNGLRSIVREKRPEVAHVQYMAPGALPIIILKALGIKKFFFNDNSSFVFYTIVVVVSLICV